MTANLHTAYGDPERRRDTFRSRDEATSPLDEPLVFCSPEDRWHDRILVGLLMLIVTLVGLVTTLLDLLPLLG